MLPRLPNCLSKKRSQAGRIPPLRTCMRQRSCMPLRSSPMYRMVCAQNDKWKNAVQPLPESTTGLGGDGLSNASVGATGTRKAFMENDSTDAAGIWFWRKVQNRNETKRSLSQTLDILRSAHYITGLGLTWNIHNKIRILQYPTVQYEFSSLFST